MLINIKYKCLRGHKLSPNFLRSKSTWTFANIQSDNPQLRFKSQSGVMRQPPTYLCTTSNFFTNMNIWRLFIFWVMLFGETFGKYLWKEIPLTEQIGRTRKTWLTFKIDFPGYLYREAFAFSRCLIFLKFCVTCGAIRFL